MLKFKNQIVIWNSFKSKAGTLFAYHFICLSITDKPSQYMFNVSPRIVNLKDRPLNDVLKIDLSLSIHKSVKTDDLRKTIIQVSTTSIWPLLCLFPFFWQLNKWLLILHLRREIYYLHRFPSCIGAFKKLFCVSKQKAGKWDELNAITHGIHVYRFFLWHQIALLSIPLWYLSY